MFLAQLFHQDTQALGLPLDCPVQLSKLLVLRENPVSGISKAVDGSLRSLLHSPRLDYRDPRS